MKLLLATHNEHKRREFARLLACHGDGAECDRERIRERQAAADRAAAGEPGCASGDGAVGGYEVEALPAAVVLPREEGETFAENALGKARAAAEATGRVSIADDSGIEAAALGGAPGVRSARYAGEGASEEENLQKLLREVPAGSALEYACAIAYVDPVHGVEHVFEGRCGGRLAAEPRGHRGFGYDPAFLAEAGPAGLTMAELSDAQKDAISHRGHAARALLAWLTEG
jgi:XTP/dITP diphosphohydrolase